MTQDEINAVKKAAEKMRRQESAQDEIIEMAREAGLYQDINVSFHQALRNFYDLAIAKEREACAKVAEHSFGVIGSTIALAIRARGEQA
jgi:citrate lyase alpha subunit